MIKHEEVKPEPNDKNWSIAGAYKFEFIQKDLWTNVPREHWSREIAKKIYINSGLYVNPDHPNEVVRIVGEYPEYGVYIFTKKE
jgi:hypothetical protein